MKRRVTHHALDPDAGVYRLVHAAEVVELVRVPGEDGEFEEREERSYSDHRDVVWAADDPRWEGMSAEAIAQTQRAEVSEAWTKAVARAEREATERDANLQHLPESVGEEI